MRGLTWLSTEATITLMQPPKAIARDVIRALSLLSEVGASEVYLAQARRTKDRRTAAVLRQIGAHEATHACEARARVRSPEPLRKAAEAAARAGGGLLGALTSLGGDRVALAFDLAVAGLQDLGYRADMMLMPADARSSDRRVLQRVIGEEKEHRNLLRDRLGI